MKIVWSRRAAANLIQLRQFIEQDRPEAAAGVAVRILDSIENLAKQPNAGRPGRISGMRELVVLGTSFIVPCRIRGASLEIIAVFHGTKSGLKGCSLATPEYS
jgi:plasmid stabilization system protein ParE